MSEDARLAKAAEKVVGQILAVRGGENVCIVRDSDESQPLVNALIAEVQKAGAEPVVVTIIQRSVGGEELPPIVAGAFLQANVVINVCRWAVAHSRAGTAALKAGARLGEMRGFFEGVLDSPGLFADYEQIRRNVHAMDKLLEAAREVHITTAEGTDLKMQLCGRKAKPQTGFATEPGTFSGLPDGESTVAPLEGTTQGRVVNPYIMEKIGLIDSPFVLEVRDGWIVNVEGGRAAGALREFLENKDPNARRFASQFAMGMNPDCRISTNAREVSKKLGTIHLALGDNITLDGTVQSGAHIDIIVLNPTVALDGKVVLQDGRLYL